MEQKVNKNHPPPSEASQVNITLNAAERVMLDEAARRAFLKPTTFARTVLLAGLAKPTAAKTS